MSYDITVPVKLGLFTLFTAILIFYFFWLASQLSHRPKRDFMIVAIIHMVIMVIGLLLTGVR